MRNSVPYYRFGYESKTTLKKSSLGKKKTKTLGKEQITTNPEYLETDMLAGSGVSRPQIQAISIKILIVVECSV